MAFWGTEVKPGKPYTHSFDRVRGRLRISQATLAIGSSTKKSFIQCNIGDKSPVLLCALLPDKTDSLQLDLEFEETEDVVFSVIGPRGVYLTGYYVGNSRHSHLHDDSESYGEDIANTETEESNRCSDEDEYEGSFINDGEPEVRTPSPASSGGVEEEVGDIKEQRNGKGNRGRLKKKYQSIVSDDEMSSEQKNTENGFAIVLESGDEDDKPISSICKDKENKMIPEAPQEKINEEDDTHAKTVADVIDPNEKGDTQFKDDKTKCRKEDPPSSSLLSLDIVGPANKTKSKKKRKDASKKGKDIDADTVNLSSSPKGGKPRQDEANTNNIGANLPASIKQDHEVATVCSLLTSTKLGIENDRKSKKKRREHSIKGSILDSDTGSIINALKEDAIQHAEAEADNMNQDVLKSEDGWRPIHDITLQRNRRIDHSQKSLPTPAETGPERSSKAKKKRKGLDDVKADSMGKDLLVRSEQDHQPTTDTSFNIVSDQLADGNQSEDKNPKKKKRRRSKTQEIEEDMNTAVKAKDNSSKVEFVEKNADARSSEVRTLSNGLIIEELGTSNLNGKKAAPGKKVKVQYLVKLKENGHVIDSNIGKSPYKFRLGDKEAIEGLNVGLDGMRVGDKRRLIIPPSMCSGREGTAENIPPNSWLVYDVELVGVH